MMRIENEALKRRFYFYDDVGCHGPSKIVQSDAFLNSWFLKSI